MKLFNCESPQTITNRYTGDVMTVPCGKCKTCLHKRALAWVDRLENERKSHPYCIFFTLTYNNNHLPKFSVYGQDLVDRDSGEMVHVPDLVYEDSRDYLLSRDYVCHPSVTDIQKFIKRIRSKVNYNETEKLRKDVRYFIVSEYGPTEDKHRVHYHGLLFTDSYWLARNYKDVITSAWSTDNRSSDREQIGFITCRFVTETSGSYYTALYMYYLTDLPKVYQLKALRPVKLCSRHPALGSLHIKDEDLQEYLFNGVTRVGEYSSRTSSFVYKPLSSAVKNKLFPKIKGFSKISHFDRVRLYEFILERQSEIGSFSEFLSYLKTLRYKLNIPDGELQIPFLVRESKHYVDEFLYQYFLDMTPPFPLDYDLIDIDYERYKKNIHVCRASRFYGACRRLYHNMLLFGVSTVSEYVTLMEQYFDNCNKQNLLEQYDFCEHYDGDKSDLDFIDIRYAERKGMDYHLHPDYIDMVNTSNEIKTKGEKKKIKNAYMRNNNYKVI